MRTGGVTCQWGAGANASIYSWADASPAQRAEARQVLASLGYVEEPGTNGSVFADPLGEHRQQFAVTPNGVFGVTGDAEFDDLVDFS